MTTERSGLRPYDSDIGIREMGDLWILWRRGLRLRCALWSHPLGWELRLQQNDALLRSLVCKTQMAVFDASDNWRVDAIAKGWHALY